MLSLEGRRILVVEDDAVTAIPLAAMLAAAGALTGAAGSLAEARERLAGDGFDAVLLDLYLPDSAGVDTVRAVRALTAAPVVVLTADQDAGLHPHLVGAGAQDVIVKADMTPALVLRCLLHVIELSRRYKAGGELTECVARLREIASGLTAGDGRCAPEAGDGDRQGP